MDTSVGVQNSLSKSREKLSSYFIPNTPFSQVLRFLRQTGEHAPVLF
jgi:hypothetical protein